MVSRRLIKVLSGSLFSVVNGEYERHWSRLISRSRDLGGEDRGVRTTEYYGMRMHP